ncbi:MAG TPA: hypothetical protein VE326_10605 [Candidatus Binatia bacterium]|nr:hypothetical protein [Candidatus Binatia bacterium]
MTEIVRGREEAAASASGAESAASGSDPAQDPAVKARLRRILLGITILCLILGAAGYAFVQWMASLPPGTLKKP